MLWITTFGIVAASAVATWATYRWESKARHFVPAALLFVGMFYVASTPPHYPEAELATVTVLSLMCVIALAVGVLRMVHEEARS